MLARFWSQLPLARRLPLIAGLATALAAVATTQTAMRALHREASRDAARIGAVYLDGLAASLAEVLERGDAEAARRALERALRFQEGVWERQIRALLPEDGGALAVGNTLDEPPFARGDARATWEPAADGRTAWAQRRVALPDGRSAWLAVQLDLSEATDRRAALWRGLLLLDVALALLAGLAAAWVTRRAFAPVRAFTEALHRVGEGRFEPLRHRWQPGTEAARLADAANLMMARLAERESLAARLAEREQAAQLGELAATVAHEVRNPLAGMLTAIGSARRFGDDRAAREESLALVERGLRQIERVVEATLAAHRGSVALRPLTPADLDDLLRLLQPEAARAGVVLAAEGRLEAPFPTDAVPVRQALLNLLLNAVRATPRGGRVVLAIRADPEEALVLAVTDEGPGLPEPQRRQLGGGARPGPGLGLEVVMREIARLDGEIAVAAEPGRATRITIRLPPRRDLAA